MSSSNVPHDALSTLGTNLKWIHEVEAIGRSAAQQSCPVIALKGFGMLLTIYRGREQERSMADVDLLVLESDASTLGEVLREHGFEALQGRNGAFVRLTNDSTATHIDLHTEMAPWTHHDLDDVWTRSFEVAGSAFRVLAPEDQILLVAHHSVTRHVHLRPNWIQDLNELLELPIDAHRVVREARRLDMLEPLRLALDETRGHALMNRSIAGDPTGRSPRARFRRAILRRGLRGSERAGAGPIVQILTSRSPHRALWALLFPDRRDLDGRHGSGPLPVRRIRRLGFLAQRLVEFVRKP